MAQIALTVVGNLEKLKKQIKRMLQEGFDIKLKGKRSAGEEGDEEEKQSGFLGIIAKWIPFLVILKKLDGIFKILDMIVGFMVFGLLTLIKWIKGLVEAFPTPFDFLWTKIKELWSAIWDWFKGTKIGKSLLGAWNKLKELKAKWDEFVKRYPTPIDFLREKILELWGKVWEWFKGTKIGKWLMKVWQKIKDVWAVIKGVFKTAKKDFENGLKVIKTWFSKVWDVIKKLPGQIWNFLKALPEKIWTFLKEGFDTLKDWLSKLWDILKALPEKIWNFMKDLPGLIADALRNVGGFLKSIFSGDDFVVTKKGDIIKTNPNDTIIATQNPSGAGGGGTFNFYGVTPQEMIDVIKRELGVDLIRSGRF